MFKRKLAVLLLAALPTMALAKPDRAPADAQKLVLRIGAPTRDSILVQHFTVASRYGFDHPDEKQTRVTVTYPGVFLSKLQTNADGSIGAVEMKPATHVSDVLVFRRASTNTVVAVPEFAGQVDGLLRRKGYHVTALYDMRVDSIRGNVLSLNCEDSGKPAYRIQVSLDKNGLLHLLVCKTVAPY